MIENRNRPSLEEYALSIAKKASERSEDPYIQVGACALGFDNMVLGTGYNGLAPGKEAPDYFWDDRDKRLPYMIHAETNLTSLFKRGQCKLVAVTLLPCSSCAQLLCAYGVKKVVFEEEYGRDKNAYEIFKFYGVEVQQIKI